MILTDFTVGGYFQAQCKRGGVVFEPYTYAPYTQEKTSYKTMPIFKGLRIHMDTMKPHESSNYEIKLPRVDRKAGKEVTAKYKDPFAIASMMMMSMDRLAIEEEFKDAHDEIEAAIPLSDENNYGRWWNSGWLKQATKYAGERLNTDSLRGVSLMMLLNNTEYCRGIGRQYHSHNFNVERALDKIYDTVKRATYVAEDTFTYKTYKYGDEFPTNNWDVIVTVNGQPVKRYR